MCDRDDLVIPATLSLRNVLRSAFDKIGCVSWFLSHRGCQGDLLGNTAPFRIGTQPARGEVLHDGYPAGKTCGLNPVIVGAELLGPLQVRSEERRVGKE